MDRLQKKIYKIWLLAAAAVVLLNGCGEKENPQDTDDAAEKAVEEMVEEAVGETNEKTAEETASEEKEGAASAIKFEGRDMEGNIVSSDIFLESKLTMVNVWATYCNPCLMEMPGLGELARAYDPERVRLIGIISDVLEGADQEMTDLAAELIEETGADYTHLLLNESLYYALLTDVTAVPTTFFIDENGNILDTVVGAMEKSVWEEKINEFLEK